MEKKLLGIVGAITGLASLNIAQAAVATPNPSELKGAQSFADLLEAIPNAVAMLLAADAAAIDAARARKASGQDADLMLAQYHHHHHHHHHRYHHHHHHHHHRVNVAPLVRRLVRPHHHHHHHDY
jgi:hypothetical protein